MESLSDIVAEYRRDYEDMKARRLYLPTSEYLRRLLDRIEAAWKRERAEVEAIVEAARTAEKSSAVGNAAAMREALVAIGETYREHPYDHDDDAIANIVDVALAAPPRNCDLKECSSDDGMISAHERFCESWHDDGNYCSDCPYNNHKSKQLITCRERWLLAPAAERKGEDDAE